jgi:hypothetical protein
MNSRIPNVIPLYQQSLIHTLCRKSNAVVGIIFDSSGELVNCAIQAGVRRIVLLEHDSVSFAVLQMKYDSQWRGIDNLDISFGNSGDLKIDIFMFELKNEVCSTLTLPFRIARYRQSDVLSVMIPCEITLWIVPISNSIMQWKPFWKEVSS